MSNVEKRAEQAIKEVLLKQIPAGERDKWDKRRPTKKELEVAYKLVKR